MTTQEKLEQFKKVIEKTLIKPEVYGFTINDMFIAGGCIRSIMEGEKPKDVDIFFNHNVDLKKVRDYFSFWGSLNASFTENAITLIIDGMKYQFITTCKGTPLDIVNEFDFTMNMNYFDFSDDLTYIQDEVSIMYKQLKINLKCRNKLGTLARIVKFVERGYKIPTKVNLLELGVQLTQENSVNDFETLQTRSRLFIGENDYDTLSVVSNSKPYSEVSAKYAGSSI